MSYKTINGLMRHLRENNGINISGSTQKRLLTNMGYFHGYKGYRFFKNTGTRIPFCDFDEIFATVQYDSEIKSLLYGEIMFIETAVKNIALETILDKVGSENIQDMYNKAINSYRNAPVTATDDNKKKFQQNKLNLQKSIQSCLTSAYRNGNSKITHFYNNAGYSDVPLWALFEIMMMADFGYLLSCLTYDIRNDISKRLGLNLSCDTDRQLIYKYIYAIKDLRNAIAHNSVVFDTRFRTSDPSRAMKQCLVQEFHLPYVNFKTIGDYIILVCYYLKMLHLSKTEIKRLVRNFEKMTNNYQNKVSQNVSAIVIHPDLAARMNTVKNYI